jgi:hypothetical protein
MRTRIQAAAGALAVLTTLGAGGAGATPLSQRLDQTGAGLSIAQGGVGLENLGASTFTINVQIGGPVRAAFLYWAGRDFSCAPDCVVGPAPFKDQELIFDGQPIQGDVVGSEEQGGPRNNLGYVLDVSAAVQARYGSPGLYSFGIADGDLANNLDRLNGASLVVVFTDESDPQVYRVQVFDGLDFAFDVDGIVTSEEERTEPVAFGYDAEGAARTGRIFVAVGDPEPDRPDSIALSDNPTLENTLDESAGPEWDADEFDVNVPAGATSTSVQMISGPPGLGELPGEPDSLLWTMAALRLPVNPACSLAVDKTCLVDDQAGLACEAKIAATLLRYTGPSRGPVNVTFTPTAKGVPPTVYSNVNLVSGVTVLSGPGGYTVDGRPSDLGPNLIIAVNGTSETIHTSCSTPYVAGQPAPLNNPKGAPSPNWFVEGFVDKLGTVVSATPPEPSDECTVAAGDDGGKKKKKKSKKVNGGGSAGADVTYFYEITNTGQTDVTFVTAVDDKLGPVPGSPVALIGAGDSVTLTADAFVSQTTTNKVVVEGETASGAVCRAEDTAKVTVEGPPFECRTPMESLTMIWNGAAPIRVKAWKGAVGSTLLADVDNLAPGQEITVTGYSGAPNDVIWEIFTAGTSTKIGESTFHISCSDDDMDGPEDCGKAEGDGKGKAGFVNTWILGGLVTAGGSFDCTP